MAEKDTIVPLKKVVGAGKSKSGQGLSVLKRTLRKNDLNEEISEEELLQLHLHPASGVSSTKKSKPFPSKGNSPGSPKEAETTSKNCEPESGVMTMDMVRTVVVASSEKLEKKMGKLYVPIMLLTG